MIRSLLVDDEPRAVKALEILLEKYCPEIKVVGTASNIKDAYHLIVREKPNLLFLDINMPNGTGLELIERIKETEDTRVIFITAYQEYAVKALRLSAIDYLLKPVDKNELVLAVGRYKKQTNQSSHEQLSILYQLMEKQKRDTIVVNTVEGIHVVELPEVYYLSSEKNYTIFHLHDSTIVSAKPLGGYEKLLMEDHFIRVHRSYLINLRQVREYNKKKAGILLKNGDFIEVSRNRKEHLIDQLRAL